MRRRAVDDGDGDDAGIGRWRLDQAVTDAQVDPLLGAGPAVVCGAATVVVTAGGAVLDVGGALATVEASGREPQAASSARTTSPVSR